MSLLDVNKGSFWQRTYKIQRSGCLGGYSGEYNKSPQPEIPGIVQKAGRLESSKGANTLYHAGNANQALHLGTVYIIMELMFGSLSGHQLRQFGLLYGERASGC